MDQNIVVMILFVLVLPCFLVRSKNSTQAHETNKKNSIARESRDSWDISACGKRILLNEKSQRGTITNILMWPWVASIYYTDPSETEAVYYGTASIITEKFLITVAQVVIPRNNTSGDIKPSDFFAVVGGEFGGEGLIYDIESINLLKALNGDDPALGGVALVKLMNAMTLTDTVRPICLPSVDDDGHQNQSLTVASWTFLSNNSSHEALYEVDVPILPESICQQYIQGKYPIKNLICGRKSKKTASKIGNGAPLMTSLYDPSNDSFKFILIGLTDRDISRNPFNASTEMPIYFLKVAAFMEWITKFVINN